MPPVMDRTTLAAKYEAGEGCVLWVTGPADLQTPVGAYLKLAHGHPNSFLLESVEGGSARGRYSIIGMAPDLIWRSSGGRAEVNRSAGSHPDRFVEENSPPLEALKALVTQARLDLPAHLPPMIGGLVGYLGYDMVRQMEHLPDAPPTSIDVPDAILLRPTLFVVFDNVRDELTLACPVYPAAGKQADSAYDDATALMRGAMAALDREPASSTGTPAPLAERGASEPVANMTKIEFLAKVETAKRYVEAGDAFQIVISQRFSAPFALPPFALYRSLRTVNPAPFLVYMDFGSFAVACSSPEILVRVRDGTVTIRPLAGTRRRGATREEDERLESDLLADEKERAEHLMLLDLARNDVGRVSRPGTVEVTESFAIERFSHVMHISSNVEGSLRPDVSALDALAAGFPAGTLSGAPKIRAMQIIDELEPSRRGIYGGCIGYFAADGTMDTCIALRMAVVTDGTMHVQAGAGIVADSVPESEYEETRLKAGALFKAADMASRFVGVTGPWDVDAPDPAGARPRGDIRSTGSVT